MSIPQQDIDRIAAVLAHENSLDWERARSFASACQSLDAARFWAKRANDLGCRDMAGVLQYLAPPAR